MANLTRRSRSKGTATIIFRAWARAGMKRAPCQCSSEKASRLMQGHPSAGSSAKSIPCRQAGNPLSRQAARLQAKLLLTTSSLWRSSCSLSRLLFCRIRVRSLPICSASDLLLQARAAIKSAILWRHAPEDVYCCLAVLYSGHAQTTWNSSSRNA